MEYNEYISNVKKEILSFMPSEYQKAKVQIDSINVINEKNLDGLKIIKGDESIIPTLNLNSYYSNDMNINMIIKNIAMDYLQAVDKTPMTSTIALRQYILDFSKAKDLIDIHICNTEKNTYMLSNIPHMNIFDLSLYFVLMVPDQENVFIKINNGILDKWGISVGELYEAAQVNVKDDIYIIPDFDNISSGLKLSELNISENNEYFILTNKSMINGASIFFYPGVQEALSVKLGCSYFMIPSSVHETIILKDNVKGINPNVIMKSFNTNINKENEYLADHAYYYDAKKRELSICTNKDIGKDIEQPIIRRRGIHR